MKRKKTEYHKNYKLGLKMVRLNTTKVSNLPKLAFNSSHFK